MKYVPVVLALISSSAFAEQFSYLEFTHSAFDSDYGMKYGSNALAVSAEADKNVAVFASYEKTDNIKYSDAEKVFSNGFGDNSIVTASAPSQSYSDSNATVGLRAFSDFAKNATAYIDLKYHSQSFYKSTGSGLGSRFGVRLSPFQQYSQFKVGAFIDATLTDISSFYKDDISKVSLNLTQKSFGIEALYRISSFSFGASAEQAQLVHKFTFKAEGFENVSAHFTDNYRIAKLFAQYHF